MTLPVPSTCTTSLCRCLIIPTGCSLPWPLLNRPSVRDEDAVVLGDDEQQRQCAEPADWNIIPGCRWLPRFTGGSLMKRGEIWLVGPTGTVTASSSSCTGIAGSDWCQSYSDDIYGNNTMTNVNLGAFTAPSGYDAARANRIFPNGGSTGWNYDLAGNLNRDPGNTSYAFDAEGRMTAACPNQLTPAMCTNQWATGQILYTYDGNGNRVRMNHEDGTTTTYVYDAGGALAAEYGGAAQTSGTQYLVTDALGSTRLVLSSTGCVTARMDYLPFGFTIPSTVGPRAGISDPQAGVTGTCNGTVVATYTQDPAFRQRFTAKERDAETGLDYFGARYYSGAHGRFTSPDWSATPQPVPYANLSDPQTLNLYSYVRNNPLSKSDPDFILRRAWKYLFPASNAGSPVRSNAHGFYGNSDSEHPSRVRGCKPVDLHDIRARSEDRGTRRRCAARTRACRNGGPRSRTCSSACGEISRGDGRKHQPHQFRCYGSCRNPGNGGQGRGRRSRCRGCC